MDDNDKTPAIILQPTFLNVTIVQSQSRNPQRVAEKAKQAAADLIRQQGYRVSHGVSSGKLWVTDGQRVARIEAKLAQHSQDKLGPVIKRRSTTIRPIS